MRSRCPALPPNRAHQAWCSWSAGVRPSSCTGPSIAASSRMRMERMMPTHCAVTSAWRLEISRLAGETLRPFEAREAETWLVDVTQADAPALLYHHIDGAETHPESGVAPDMEQLRQGIYQETGHSFAGREWVLISRPHRLDNGLRDQRTVHRHSDRRPRLHLHAGALYDRPPAQRARS